MMIVVVVGVVDDDELKLCVCSLGAAINDG